ncbi:MAG: hypothetical protein M2R45_03766 [Verrucomicrobia subdivision 3 bacterium]|nr:hypothetical protein [Limisphaerales bacterium]MCS1416910.1 hypothetical protein [Limisphaerales bacterium]
MVHGKAANNRSIPQPDGFSWPPEGVIAFWSAVIFHRFSQIKTSNNFSAALHLPSKSDTDKEKPSN